MGAVEEEGGDEESGGIGVVDERWEEGREGDEDEDVAVELDEAGGGADDTCRGCFVDHLWIVS